LLSSNISYTCPHNMVNFGPLAAEIVSLVWGTPSNLNEFCVLATLLHGTLVVVISQTLRRWTESATYVWQGGHHVAHWPTFLVLNWFLFVYTSYAVECRIAAVKLDQLCRSQFAFQKCMLDRCTLSMHYAGCVSWTGTCTPVSYLYSTESTSMSLLCVTVYCLQLSYSDANHKSGATGKRKALTNDDELSTKKVLVILYSSNSHSVLFTHEWWPLCLLQSVNLCVSGLGEQAD